MRIIILFFLVTIFQFVDSYSQSRGTGDTYSRLLDSYMENGQVSVFTDSLIIENYHKHWEEAKPWGWELRIAHGDSVLKIDLKWKTYRRSGLLKEEKDGKIK